VNYELSPRSSRSSTSGFTESALHSLKCLRVAGRPHHQPNPTGGRLKSGEVRQRYEQSDGIESPWRHFVASTSTPSSPPLTQLAARAHSSKLFFGQCTADSNVRSLAFTGACRRESTINPGDLPTPGPLNRPLWHDTCLIHDMSKPTQLQCTVVLHDTRNALAVQLEDRIKQLREPKPNRRQAPGLRSNLVDIVLGDCDVTYVVLRECWKLR